MDMKKPLDVVVEELNKMVETWMDKYKVLTIPQLIDLRSRLTGYLYTFSEYIGEIKEEHLRRETVRKIVKSEKRRDCIVADMSIAKSEDAAILASKSEQEAADKYEGWYIKLRLTMEAANKVDDAIAQRISWMRKEKERENA